MSVGQVLSEVHQQRGYSGDHTTDQTGDKQHLAGLGWARSTADVGIEDWGFQHPMQALVCSNNGVSASSPTWPRVPRGAVSVGAQRTVASFEVGVASQAAAAAIPAQLARAFSVPQQAVNPPDSPPIHSCANADLHRLASLAG